MIERVQSDLRIDDKHDRIGFLSGRLGLTPRCFGECFAVRSIGIGIDARGIDDAKRTAAPFAQRVEAIARHAGRIFDDRQALADQTVEEGTFSDVRTADDGNGGRAEHGPRRGRSLLHRLSFRNDC